MVKLEFENVIDDNDGKNKVPVYCSRCPSKILNTKTATYKSIQFNLPYLQKKGDDDAQIEEISDYWEVPDMYTFENMGFLNTTKDEKKYLICADCEMGPLGWMDLKTKINYVALPRVKHKDDAK